MLSIEIEQVKTIQPAIALSNRSFWGLTYSGYPIRSYSELISFIRVGQYSISLPENDGYIHFKAWENECFQTKDLLVYFSSDSWHSIMYDSMIPVDTNYGYNLFKSSHTVDFGKVISALEMKYKKATSP